MLQENWEFYKYIDILLDRVMAGIAYKQKHRALPETQTVQVFQLSPWLENHEHQSILNYLQKKIPEGTLLENHDLVYQAIYDVLTVNSLIFRLFSGKSIKRQEKENDYIILWTLLKSIKAKITPLVQITTSILPGEIIKLCEKMQDCVGLAFLWQAFNKILPEIDKELWNIAEEQEQDKDLKRDPKLAIKKLVEQRLKSIYDRLKIPLDLLAFCQKKQKLLLDRFHHRLELIYQMERSLSSHRIVFSCYYNQASHPLVAGFSHGQCGGLTFKEAIDQYSRLQPSPAKQLEPVFTISALAREKPMLPSGRAHMKTVSFAYLYQGEDILDGRGFLYQMHQHALSEILPKTKSILPFKANSLHDELMAQLQAHPWSMVLVRLYSDSNKRGHSILVTRILSSNQSDEYYFFDSNIGRTSALTYSLFQHFLKVYCAFRQVKFQGFSLCNIDKAMPELLKVCQSLDQQLSKGKLDVFETLDHYLHYLEDPKGFLEDETVAYKNFFKKSTVLSV